jgi:hypothetical protein
MDISLVDLLVAPAGGAACGGIPGPVGRNTHMKGKLTLRKLLLFFLEV